MHHFRWLIIFVLLSSSTNMMADSSVKTPFIKGQVWQGWYNCDEGKTQLNLTVTNVKNSSAGQLVQGVYNFTTEKGVNGAFNTRGKYRSSNKSAAFRPLLWIKHAKGYAAPRFSGIVSDNGEDFIGKINHLRCKDFHISTSDKYKVIHQKKAIQKVVIQKTQSVDKIKNHNSKQASKLSEKDIREQFRIAQNETNKGNYDLAESIFHSIIQQKPKQRYISLAKRRLDGIDRLRKKSLPKNNKAPVVTADSSIEQAIAAKLPEIERLPVLYVNETRSWPSKQLNFKNTLGRELIEKYPFPMNPPVSIAEISKRQANIELLIKKLEQKRKSIQNSMRSNPQTRNGLPIESQHKIASEILYPKVVEIQSKIIDMLSRVPRTKLGFNKAYELKDWLRKKRFGSRWLRIIKDYTNTRTNFRSPVAVCTYESTTNQVSLDKNTGRCFLEIEYANYLLQNAWRIQYSREMDTLWAKQISDEGAEANLKIFSFTLDIWLKEFSNGLVRMKTTPPNDNTRCLFDNCSSKIISLFLDETNDKPLTEKRKQKYLALIQNKSTELLNRWNKSAGMSKLDRYEIQTEMVDTSRSLARNIITKLSDSAVKELASIAKNDHRAYQRWNKYTARPIRQQSEKWRSIWDIGFGITTANNASSALGLSSFKDGYLRARDTGGSPFVGISEIILGAQYQWLANSEKNTAADPKVKFPIRWSSSRTYQAPRPPRYNYAQLITPNELFFESIGYQVGQAAGAIVSFSSDLQKLDQAIKISRRNFFECLPDCPELELKRAIYSKLLLEKDLYFLSVSGGSGSLANEGIRNMSTVVEGISGSRGASFIDNGIPKICSGYFERWVTKYGDSHGRDGRAEIDKLFGALSKLTSGNFSGLKQQGFNLVQKQKQAFSKSEKEYRQYQVCRDQFEFDQYEH